MFVSPTIQASRENKIARMMQITGCDRDHAITYLMNAAWYVPDAVNNYGAAH